MSESAHISQDAFRSHLEKMALLFDGEGGSTHWASVLRKIADNAQLNPTNSANQFMGLLPGMGNLGDWIFYTDHDPDRANKFSYVPANPLEVPINGTAFDNCTFYPKKDKEFLRLVKICVAWAKQHSTYELDQLENIASVFQ